MSNEQTKSTNSNVISDKKDAKDDKLSMPRQPDQKSFMRQDANYVCTVCKAKFFTKVDVEEHFFKHPLVEKV
ncbi:MAG: hypothetical protein V4591_08495 [Bdellovibrionota bacterium]